MGRKNDGGHTAEAYPGLFGYYSMFWVFLDTCRLLQNLLKLEDQEISSLADQISFLEEEKKRLQALWTRLKNLDGL